MSPVLAGRFFTTELLGGEGNGNPLQYPGLGTEHLPGALCSGTGSPAREGRDLGVAFQAPPGSQASSRGEAKVEECSESSKLHSVVVYPTPTHTFGFSPLREALLAHPSLSEHFLR